MTPEEIKAQEQLVEKTKSDTRAAVEAELLKDTTWKSPQDMRESALNADKRIGESVRKEKAAEERAKAIETELSTLKEKGNANKGNDGQGEEEIKDPASILRTMSADEEKMLDELVRQDANLKSQVLSGGEKAMAKTLLSLRKLSGSGKGANPDSPFSDWKKSSATNPAVSIEQLVKQAHEQYLKRVRTPSSRSAGARPAIIREGSGSDDDSRPAVRAGGGLREFAAPNRGTDDE